MEARQILVCCTCFENRTVLNAGEGSIPLASAGELMTRDGIVEPNWDALSLDEAVGLLKDIRSMLICCCDGVSAAVEIASYLGVREDWIADPRSKTEYEEMGKRLDELTPVIKQVFGEPHVIAPAVTSHDLLLKKLLGPEAAVLQKAAMARMQARFKPVEIES